MREVGNEIVLVIIDVTGEIGAFGRRCGIAPWRTKRERRRDRERDMGEIAREKEDEVCAGGIARYCDV